MKTYLLSISIILLFVCSFSFKESMVFIKPKTEVKTQDSLQESIVRGRSIYIDFCVQCHMVDGIGVPGTFPPLSKSNWLAEKRIESIRAIKFGQKGEIKVNGIKYNGYMAPMGLTDEEIADVLNYVMNSWGNTQNKRVTIKEVSKVVKD